MSKTPAGRKISHAQRHVVQFGIDSAVQPGAVRQEHDLAIQALQVRDGYDTPKYKLERLIWGGMAASMEHFLRLQPNMRHEHPLNLARHGLYMLQSMRHWTTLMPDSLAMEPIHHPEQPRIATGHRLGFFTRRLFRHGKDPIGARTRTMTAGWLAHQYAVTRSGEDITWLSLAGGTAAPTMLMVAASGIQPWRLRYVNVDRDPPAIELAADITAEAGLSPARTSLVVGDVLDADGIKRLCKPGSVDIVDLMGILEYFDDTQASQLLRISYDLLKPEGMILGCNMRDTHPELNLHKRGLGWPGVCPRSVVQLRAIIDAAQIPHQAVTLYQPADGVYNVIRIIKP